MHPRDVVTLVVLPLVAACGSGGGGGSSTPAATTTFPASGAQGVDPETTIRVVLDAPSGTPAAGSVQSEGATVPGTWSQAGGTLEFVPDARLCLLAWHSVELAPGAGGPFTFTFRVRDGAWSTAEELAPQRLVRGLAVGGGERVLALLATPPAPGADLWVVEREDDSWGAAHPVVADASAEGAALVAGANGEDVVVYCARLAGGGFRVFAARRAPGATQFGVAVPLAPPMASSSVPRALALPWGTLALWHDPTTGDVRAATARHGEPWTSAQRLDDLGADAGPPAAAADGAGALVAWRQASGTEIVAARLAEDGTFGAPELVEEALACCLSDPLVAAGGGETLVAWHADGLWRARAAGDTSVQAAFVGGGACAGPPSGAVLALGADGTAVAAWICDGAPWAAVRLPGQPFGPEVALALPAGAANLALVVDRGGRALVAWDELQAAGGRVPRTARFDGEAFGAPRALVEPAGDCAVAPRLAIGADGRIAAAWTRTVDCDFTHGFGAGAARFE